MQNRKRHRCIKQTFGLCRRSPGWDVSREQHRKVYYLGWNRSPAQVGCMRQALGPGALGRPRGIGWRGRWEEGSGWGTQEKKKKRVPFISIIWLTLHSAVTCGSTIKCNAEYKLYPFTYLIGIYWTWLQKHLLSEEELKSLLMMVKEENKNWLKTQHSKN